MEYRQVHLKNEIFIHNVAVLLREGLSVRFVIRGWSMRPLIEHERDEALIEPYKNRFPRRGDVVLAQTANGDYVLHRIVRIAGSICTLQGDGNPCRKEVCSTTDILGVAVGFYRKRNKSLLRTDALTWKLYSWIWMKLLPLRAPLLFLYRRWRSIFPIDC